MWGPSKRNLPFGYEFRGEWVGGNEIGVSITGFTRRRSRRYGLRAEIIGAWNDRGGSRARQIDVDRYGTRLAERAIYVAILGIEFRSYERWICLTSGARAGRERRSLGDGGW